MFPSFFREPESRILAAGNYKTEEVNEAIKRGNAREVGQDSRPRGEEKAQRVPRISKSGDRFPNFELRNRKDHSDPAKSYKKPVGHDFVSGQRPSGATRLAQRVRMGN